MDELCRFDESARWLLTERRSVVSTTLSPKLVVPSSGICMTTHVQTSRLTRAGRWLAISALAVLLSGRLVHIGQECGGCCSSSHCHATAAESRPTERPCPFGCEHHSHDAPNEPCSSDTPNSHDEHDCAICSVLSHVTQCPELVGLPAESELVAANVWTPESTVTAEVLFPVDPRGPPSIG